MAIQRENKIPNLTTTETWQHRYIITNGIRMHYVSQGEGPLIVLLHGFPEFWYSWRYQIPFLAGHGYTVIAPDLRGYNETDKPRRGYEIPTLLRDIEELVKGLGRQKAHLVGHDWGGALAWTFAMNYPEMTESLIVMNAPHPAAMMREMRTLKQLRKSWYIFAFQIPWLPEYMLGRNNANEIGRMLRGAALQKSAFPHEVTAKYQEAMSKPGAIRAAISYYRQLFRHLPFSVKSKGVQIQAPTLLIWGERDIALGIELTTGLERWVNDIQIKRIPDSGHWVQQEQPEKVNQFLLDFLQSQAYSPIDTK
ncbi:MAG TPA: alpha/beta hydrolase [Ktedonobacteraceae bacterium]|nr:alpha/beta hydrolase [Ktedonobacteraceae bacterium]